ncbi:peptidyl-tRNA hydrolase, PTH2 family [Angomonas deanei]|uniref:peptidyl-tRNA hydrolase n=1 Tax=Angomonas deanei TaxID=59799 RepID=A0A7G2CM70_9TRYP|nr:peptidyl-tRNA hydrolase, PTH2 family [Angomonas deanei]CAD2220024.1 Peptidyl-tRNA hydrolase PTH2, putative [Angomonas deanei]|eukprot:EPY42616.1 peptidyl-tRNA hydrolase, PTH2 family [Angomonas deanei]
MADQGTYTIFVLSFITGVLFAVVLSKMSGGGLFKTLKRFCSVPVVGDTKMVLVVRKDLGMGVGKIAAQCAHAAVAVVEELRAHEPKEGVNTNSLWWSWYSAWSVTGCTKIALQCPDEAAMLEIAAHAKRDGIPYYVIRDAGRTQIAAGSKTVVAVGPAPVSKINEITGKLKLL